VRTYESGSYQLVRRIEFSTLDSDVAVDLSITSSCKIRLAIQTPTRIQIYPDVASGGIAYYSLSNSVQTLHGSQVCEDLIICPD
jgi:hypothetical protein